MAVSERGDASQGSGAPTGGLERLLRDIGAQGKAAPPVERWNPPYCGDSDMLIDRSGRWHYRGSPIGRPALVKLFASVLKKEDGRHMLVTPVEKLSITVEDAPFQAVDMAAEPGLDGWRLTLRTNVDDLVTVGPDHALRFTRGAGEGVTPYVHVRRDLWARLTRALAHDLMSLGEVRAHDQSEMFGIAAGGMFFAIAPASEIEGLA